MTASIDRRLPPELLAEVASKLNDVSDLSMFSRCNRMLHDVITPLVFRHIAVLIIDDISAIADVFQRKPHLASHCRSLNLLHLNYYPSDSDVDEDEDEIMLSLRIVEAQDAICDDLATILEILGLEGKLQTFSFPPRYEFGTLVIPTRVWRALGGLSSSLVELDLMVLRTERDTWTAFCTSTFPKLRTFRLNLRKTHGWDCAPLQKMLHSLKELEILCLAFPTYKPDGLDISLSHPRLRTFYLLTDIFPETGNSFLRRHPTVERLRLQSFGQYIGLEDESDLPHLRSLCINHIALSSNYALLPKTASQWPLTHVRLEYVPDLSTPMVFERLAPLGTTLRHLEFQWIIHRFRTSVPFFGTLLVLLPGLEKLVIVLKRYDHSRQFQNTPLAAADLLNLLVSISECTSIVNLRLSDSRGVKLPQALLNHLGDVPKGLRHLCWDVQERATMYHIERCEGKTMAVDTDLGRVFPGSDEDEAFDNWPRCGNGCCN